MHTTNGISFSIDSKIAFPAKGPGTQITLAVGYTAETDSFTELNIGSPRWDLPPLPGVTPPTILVPYSKAFSVWNVPYAPVIP